MENNAHAFYLYAKEKQKDKKEKKEGAWQM